jgi:hypothetical protein
MTSPTPQGGWLLENPCFAGLISHWIDSTDGQEIESSWRKLWLCGLGILRPPEAGRTPVKRG